MDHVECPSGSPCFQLCSCNDYLSLNEVGDHPRVDVSYFSNCFLLSLLSVCFYLISTLCLQVFVKSILPPDFSNHLPLNKPVLKPHFQAVVRS